MLYLNKAVVYKQKQKQKKNSAELSSKLDTDEEEIYELEDKSEEIIRRG